MTWILYQGLFFYDVIDIYYKPWRPLPYSSTIATDEVRTPRSSGKPHFPYISDKWIDSEGGNGRSPVLKKMNYRKKCLKNQEHLNLKKQTRSRGYEGTLQISEGMPTCGRLLLVALEGWLRRQVKFNRRIDFGCTLGGTSQWFDSRSSYWMGEGTLPHLQFPPYRCLWISVYPLLSSHQVIYFLCFDEERSSLLFFNTQTCRLQL